MKKLLTTLCLTCSMSWLASAQKLDLSHLDRLADKTDQVVNVTLDEGLIRLASSFLKGGDMDDVRKILPGIRGIYVRSFEFTEDGVYNQSDLDKIDQQLKGWTPVIEVKGHNKKKETTRVMIKGVGKEVAGLVIVNASARELTVVNIAGSITVDQLEKLGGHLGIPDINVPKNNKGGSTKKQQDENEED